MNTDAGSTPLAGASNLTRTFGLKFQKNGNSHFGWIRIDLAFAGGPLVHNIPFPTTLTVLQAAWIQSPNVAAHVSGLPVSAGEPAAAGLLGLGLLAMGASGVRRFRRERKTRKPGE